MHVFITGGAGFIGSSLTEKLLELGHSVCCFDNFDNFYDEDIKRSNIAAYKSMENFRLCEGDIRDRSFLQECLERGKPDVVVHLAARPGVRPSIERPSLYFDVNINGTVQLLEAMKDLGITKLVFASSSSIYGNNKKVPFSETDTVDYPVSPYAATKKAGELICYTYHHLHAFDVYCLRYFSVYGPRQRPEMAIHNFTHKIIHDQAINMYGDGSSERDYTYIDDIVSGIISSIEKVSGYEVINLGESSTISLKNLISLLEEKIGKKAIINQLPMQAGDVDITYADIRKAAELLQYKPTTSIAAGVEKFVEWYKNTFKHD